MTGIVVLLFCFLLDSSNSARILVVPMQGKSHMIATNGIGQEMKKNGHEVYTVAEHHYESNPDKIGAVGLEVLYFNVPDGSLYADSEEIQRLLLDGILKGNVAFGMASKLLLHACNNMMADQAFMDKVASLKFDLAVVEGVPFLPCSYLLPHVMNVPHVTLIPGFFPSGIPGNVALPSFSPIHVQPTPSSMPMNFKDRLIGMVWYIMMNKQVLPRLFGWTGVMPDLNDLSLLEEYRDKGQVSDSISGWMDFFDETQLVVMVNSDLTMDYPKPLFPNVVSVEGLSVKEAKPLAKDIEKLVQSAEHGVIVVSFGSNVKGLPDEVIIKLVNVFGKRKELFLMRYVGSINNFDMPKNVKFMSWLPQNDLLAHEKVKLFITHGGSNGLHEAVYQAVPMLCVPLFGDQPSNAQKLEAKGYGLSFNLIDYTETELLEKIEKIISNPSYRENVQKASKIMKHRPLSARRTAIFWIEHVLQFGGEHLKPSSMELTWWQFYCLDTLGVIFLTVFLVVILVYKLLKLFVKILLGLIMPKTKLE